MISMIYRMTFCAKSGKVSLRMTHPWTQELERRFQEKLQRDSARTSKSIFLVMIPFFAVFALVDIATQPAHIRGLLFSIRIVGLLSLIFGYIHVKRTKRYFLTPWFTNVATTLAMTLIAMVTDGYKSSYYFGISLLLLAMSQIFFWTGKRMAVWAIGIGTTYILGTLVSVHFVVDNVKALTDVIAFIFGCSVIATWSAYLSNQLRRNAFSSLIEAESEQALHAKVKQALDARNEFISIASHELKTPLTTLKLQNWLLTQKVQKINFGSHEGSLMGYLERNERQLKRLIRLIDDMLDLSRITTNPIRLHLEEFDLRNLVEEVVEQFSNQFQAAGIQVTLKAETPVIGHWDYLRMQQVITNLFSNAIKFAKQAPLLIQLTEQGSKAILIIEDHGAGVKKEFREKIFERYERGTKDINTAGLGLGLSITRHIIEHHHGKIQITDSQPNGARFTITLPKGQKTRAFSDKPRPYENDTHSPH